MIPRLLLFLLFFFCVCAFSLDFSQIKVVEVIDGDTVRLENGKVLRYIGIDTPEVRQNEGRRWVFNPQPFALEAKEFNRSLVEGKRVRVEFDVEKKDRYGRLLGYVFLDGVFINAKLLEEGYAVIYTRPPNVKYVDLFISLQKKARQNRKGLWGSYEVVSAEDAHKFIGEIRTVKGKVRNTYQSQKCIFLNFGEDWRKDFTVVIFKDSWKYFKEKGIDPLTFYKGKIVEVTGKIREYNGPEIIVSIPYQIRIIH
ncbi:MAG: thermonuclease family protein [Candidatus Omnitrophica bacterium]|nr:thermonuclease family protein [Candidatus Omnitrophota bacterium]